MTVERSEVYKVHIYNSGTTYEDTAHRAYAWELVSLLRKAGRDNPNFSDALVIIERHQDVLDLLNQYAKEISKSE